DPPEGPEKSSGDDGVDALYEVSGPKGQTADNDSDGGTAKRALESVQDKRPLEFLANAPRYNNEAGEHDRLARSFHEVLHRVVLDGMERWRQRTNREQDDQRNRERYEDQRNSGAGLSGERFVVEEHSSRAFPVRTKKQHDQPDEEDRVAQRQR